MFYSTVAYILAFLIYPIPILAQLAPTTDVGGLPAFDNSNYPPDRNYTEVCWLTAHNAFSSKAEGWFYAQQNLSLQDQFNYGVRSFMIDLWWYDPAWLLNPQALVTLSPGPSSYVCLCHDNGVLSQFQRGFSAPTPVSEFFSQVRDWLNANNQAVITLHLEDRLDNGPLGPAAAIEGLLRDAGLLDFVYRPGTQDVQDWPTLGQMRTTGKRLIIFSDKRSDGMINVASYRETKYDLGEFPNCEMRGEGRNSNGQRKLFLLNHFYKVSLPSIYDYKGVNSCEEIRRRLESCSQSQRLLPNFIAVDYVEQGDALQIVQLLNTVKANHFQAPTPTYINILNQCTPHPMHDEL